MTSHLRRTQRIVFFSHESGGEGRSRGRERLDRTMTPQAYDNILRRITINKDEYNRPNCPQSIDPTRLLAEDVKMHMLESLWHRDALLKRSSGRGREIFRQFHRLGMTWTTVAVYESWGDLYFETYDPAVACTLSLQVLLCRCPVTHVLYSRST